MKVVLQHISNASTDGIANSSTPFILVNTLVIEGNYPANSSLRLPTSYDVEESGLSRPRGSHQSRKTPGGYVGINISEQLGLRREGVAYVCELDCRHCDDDTVEWWMESS